MLSADVIASASEIRRRFRSAEPFRHVVVDGFFTDRAVRGLLTDFPLFDPGKARNEFGKIGGKAVGSDLASISKFYREVHDYITSPNFLAAMSALTGIPDLIADPTLFGGGTHENLHGQELAPHVDFNYSQDLAYHRRLNLLLYLNEEWDEKWGGALEIHSNPRDWRENRCTAYNVSFNRAIIFETSEHSWHGFRRIDLPETKRHLSRKCLSIYLYTRSRPDQEIAPPHGTFYVQRPLETRFKEGYRLNAADIQELHRALTVRDSWIEKYQAMELSLNRQIAGQRRYIGELLSKVRLPLAGSVRQEGDSRGLTFDGWVDAEAVFKVAPEAPVNGFTLTGWSPEDLSGFPTVTLAIDGAVVAKRRAEPGTWSMSVSFQKPIAEIMAFDIACSSTFSGKSRGLNDDTREIGFALRELRFDHA